MKTLCHVHMFNYSGNTCPFCEQERIDKMYKRFIKKSEKQMENNSEPKEITQSDIERLKEKFNSK